MTFFIEPSRVNSTGRAKKPGAHKSITGSDLIDKVIRIDQSPIGRTPRSNPATYTGIFSLVRDIFAMLPESRERGYKPGRFSFNVSGGRCEACQGEGQRRIEMNFLPDVYVQCEVCGGHRYNHETLSVRYNGYSIADLLEMPVSDVLQILENIPQVRQKLQTLVDVGLGYIHLGQSAVTLSGGEAQRIKLARELSKRQTGKTLYLLDEPTTGLHFDDVRKLLDVLHRLTDLGNTVIIIEHNMDVIRNADWILDLGPEGGEEGGRIVAQGTPGAGRANQKVIHWPGTGCIFQRLAAWYRQQRVYNEWKCKERLARENTREARISRSRPAGIRVNAFPKIKSCPGIGAAWTVGDRPRREQTPANANHRLRATPGLLRPSVFC